MTPREALLEVVGTDIVLSDRIGRPHLRGLATAIIAHESGMRMNQPMSHSLTGIKGSYGPQLSDRAARVFRAPGLRLDRSYTIADAVTHEESAGGRRQTRSDFAGYPRPGHGVAHLLSMLSGVPVRPGRANPYARTAPLAAATPWDAIARTWCAGYATSPRWPRQVAETYRRLFGGQVPADFREWYELVASATSDDRDTLCELRPTRPSR